MKRDLRGKSQAEKGKRQKKKRAHKRMAGRQRQRRPDQAQKHQTTHRPGTRQWSTGRKSAGAPGTKANRPDSGRLRKSGQPRQPARHAKRKRSLRTGKIRVRSFACPEGPCEPGPSKKRFAVFGWHVFLLRIAHNAARSAEQKGAPPPQSRLPARVRFASGKQEAPTESGDETGAHSCATGTPLLACRSGAVCQWQT